MAKKSKAIKTPKDDILWEIKGILLISVGILMFFSTYSNSMGIVGVFLKKNLRGLVGQATLIIPLGFICFGAYVVHKTQYPKFMPRVLGLGMIFLVTVMLFHLGTHENIAQRTLLDRLKASADLGLKGEGGGIAGEGFISMFVGVVGTTGTYIAIGTAFVIGFLLVTNLSLSTIIVHMRTKKKRKEVKNLSTKTEDIKVLNFSQAEEDSGPEGAVDKDKDKASVPQKSAEDTSPLLINSMSSSKEDYALPPVSLLKGIGTRQRGISEKELLVNAKTLEDTLASFSIQAKVIQVSCGPTITRFELHPSPGIKVSRIVNLADDLALSLAAQAIRIEAPIPGKSAIGIEVPNKKKSLVSLREIIETPEFEENSSKMTFALGKDVGGNPIVSDLSEMPHLLIAGATGSGKSVCVNTIISSILFKARPHDVRMVMIDPKVVELADYDDIPHLLTPVVTDPKKAASALYWLVSEMEGRYQSFAQAGVKDIGKYNELYPDNPLPKVVIIIDELADLMMVSPREVEDHICRLAQMARAAGMHLVVATQRPSVDVITGLIKANIPSRLSFAVSSQVDSRTILDMSGAEKLMGRGDMLFFPVGAIKPVRLQGAYISQDEVGRLVNHIKTQQEAAYEKKPEDFENVDREAKQDAVDELFDEAVFTVLDTGKASTSYLQRKLNIGYNRAARLMDQMEERNIISSPDGNKPRDVLINRDQYEKYYGG